MLRPFIIVILLLVLGSIEGISQSDSLRNALNHLRKTKADTTITGTQTTNTVYKSSEPGDIRIHVSSSIDSLERSQRGKSEMRGYRIQVFLGTLANAKKERTKYLTSFPEESAYIVQNIPDYALRVGDFRTLPEAQKFLKDLKKYYEGAFIVQDKIDMPKLRKE